MNHIDGRTRGDLLRVLLDTAADFTALQDVEDVLQAIVRRTRTIMGVDMTYVSINDAERQETSIRQTDGVSTAAYRTLRMPLGTGVLGQIATGLAPYQTSDYLSDAALSHVPHVDEIVRAEGVQAIMGVPLTVHGHVIGALIVAERHARRFTADEIDLVDSIGTHAAVALDNSLRFEATEALTRDLELQQRRTNAELEHMSAVRDLDRRLMESIMSSPDLARVLDVGREALDSDLFFEESDGAHPAVAEEDGTVRVRAGTEELGAIRSGRPLGDRELELLERVAVHAALALLFSRAAEDADLRQQSELMDDLLSHRIQPQGRVARKMRRWGLDPSGPLFVVAIAAPQADPRQCLQALRASRTRGVVVDHQQHLCLVTSEEHWQAHVEDVFGNRRWRWQAGAVGPVDEVAALPDAHRTAELALTTLVDLGRDGVLTGDDVGFVGALLDLDQNGRLPHPLTAAIDPLIGYDREHGTDLLRTAWMYLETDGSVARTAELLHIHRNTVRQRLERTGRLLGGDWDRSPRRLETHLALRILSARHTGSLPGVGEGPPRAP
ncbi:helix-turn-helix domain-containing protein [Zhihengliuella salsuginis]|nr:helix-turn-helix domain-containing protein [Zhihengliuella salsuginis]